MKRAIILCALLAMSQLASANPFLGRWEATEIDNTRLDMHFRRDMKVSIGQKKQADSRQELGYELDPEAWQIRINGSSFHYLFLDDNHFILFPDLSALIQPGSSARAVRTLLLELARSHSLYTARRAR